MHTSMYVGLLAVLIASSSCSSDCVPSGGVLVSVVGAGSCDRISVTASDGANQYALELSGSFSADGGTVCEFQGLSGHAGTFTIQSFIDGAPAKSQTVTLEKLDGCNVTSKLVNIDVGAP